MVFRPEWITLEQDWYESRLATYLLFDVWSPDDGLCILAGFDFSAHQHGTPYQLDWTQALSPNTFQHANQEDEHQATALIDSMQEELMSLMMIWANTRRDTEDEGYSPAFFIEWALSRKFTPDWLAWAIGTGRYVPKQVQGEIASPDLDQVKFANSPELPIDAPKGERCASGSSTLVFKEMPGLIASELVLAFVGDKDESGGLGANNMLEVTARGQKRRIALAALELVDKRKGTPNGEGGVLLGLADGRKITKTGPNTQKMKRVRHVFLNHFGIIKDPFEPYMATAGWVPLFKIEDRRGAADERAKKEAEARMDSLEQLIEQGYQPRGRSNEDDAADEWLKENDNFF